MSDSVIITGLGMTCPICGGSSSVCRTINKEKEIVRYRKCQQPKCGYTFSTAETRLNESPLKD